jgi:Tol biopolymer transport system component
MVKGRFFAAIVFAAAASACNSDGASAPSKPEVPVVPPVTVPPVTSITRTGRLAFVSDRDGAPHIYLANEDGSDIRRLTSGTQREYVPAWSPDGKRLAFDGDGGSYVINADGSNLTHISTEGGSPSWSPDGQRLLLSTAEGFKIVNADGSSENVIRINHNPNGFTGDFASGVEPGGYARWSPDGTRIAFSAWTGYDFERVFVESVDGSNGRSLLRNPGWVWDECGPEWSPDGTRIALLSMIHGIAIVDATTGLATSIASPGTTCWDGYFSRVAWSPDGSMLAFTKMDPPWVQGAPVVQHTASVVIVDIESRKVRTVIPNAYGPAW